MDYSSHSFFRIFRTGLEVRVMAFSFFSALFGIFSARRNDQDVFCKKLAKLGADPDCLPPRCVRELVKGDQSRKEEALAATYHYLSGRQLQNDEINEILIRHNVAPEGIVYRDIIVAMQTQITRKQGTIDLYSRHSGDLFKDANLLKEQLEGAREVERELRRRIVGLSQSKSGDDRLQ